MADMKVTIAERDIGDFYQMVRDYSLQRGNTFHYLWNELKQRYPNIAKNYDDCEDIQELINK